MFETKTWKTHVGNKFGKEMINKMNMEKIQLQLKLDKSEKEQNEVNEIIDCLRKEKDNLESELCNSIKCNKEDQKKIEQLNDNELNMKNEH